MRSQFYLIPAAIVSFAAPAVAQQKMFMTVEEAQQRIFPGLSFTEQSATIDQDQYNKLIDETGSQPYARKVKAWRSSNGDWLVLDQVIGRNDWITYAVGIAADGRIKQIEIIECLADWDGITNPAWRAIFRGLARKYPLNMVPVISGSTQSSEQVVAGARRILSTVALVLEPSYQKAKASAHS